ncbi:FeoB-associated Cys-rich membrane protein [Adhaeribacter aquaticus]|uniref:FeoB-associated Cys-rich membrane protein n=1 Tax=Adhaeribacter aquaticus TaxID=299567 RepID=UPI000427B044|nr:FeoB-associated Cys-rich membrane protein [Adhaeribacter aquaticus]
MVQQLIIFLIFIAAAFYVGRLVYRNFSTKSGGCVKGCGSACSSIDFTKIQKNINSASQS